MYLQVFQCNSRWKLDKQNFLDPSRPGRDAHQHGDMLRYDVAFCDPTDPRRIIFPVFKHKRYGKTSMITRRRWEFFGYIIERTSETISESQVQDWITYQHPLGQPSTLKPVTLRDYLRENKYEVVGGAR